MLDALWIVAIILEQPAYALIVPSRPIRFWLLAKTQRPSRESGVVRGSEIMKKAKINSEPLCN